MQTKLNSGARSALTKAILPAIAMAMLLTGLTTAKAWDQQATDEQMESELSQRAAGVGPYGYVYAPTVRDHAVVHRYRSERGRIAD